MSELIKSVIEDAAVLNEFSTAWVLDPDESFILQIASGIHQLGIKPTLNNVKKELIAAGKESLVPLLKESMNSTSALGPQYLVMDLKEQYNKQQIFNASAKGRELIMEGFSANEAENEMMGILAKMASSGGSSDTKMASKSTMDRLSKIWSGEVKATWITGKPLLDKNLGIGPKKFYLLAANQKQGKTRFVTELCMCIARHTNLKNILWFTFEMSKEEVMICIIAYFTGISTEVVSGRDRLPNEREQTQISKCLELIPDITFFEKSCTISVIAKEVRKRCEGETLVVIDGVGLIKSEKGNDDDVRNDNHNAAELIALRDETKACIIALQHLSKEVEHHTNKSNFFEPEVRHLRGSNKYADGADAIILLHRIEMYASLEKTMSSEDWEKLKGVMLIKCPIIRNGVPFKIKARHTLSCCHTEETGMG